MMKKVMALLMAVVLMTSCMEIAFTEEAVALKTTLTNAVDLTVSEWIGSRLYRALLTVTLYYDFIINTGTKNDYSYFVQPSYVYRDGLDLYTLIPHNDGYLLISYRPSTKTGVYLIHRDVSSTVVANAIESLGYKYFINNFDDISEAIDVLSVAFQ